MSALLHNQVTWIDFFNWELSQGIIFDPAWYLHKAELVTKNEMHKILEDRIPTRRPYVVLINKNKNLVILWVLSFP